MPGNVVEKVLAHLDQHARTFIEAAPFVLVGTASPDGTGDVSPKGGPPGFVVVLDDQRLVIPDLSGNNLLDSIVVKCASRPDCERAGSAILRSSTSPASPRCQCSGDLARPRLRLSTNR
jgi:hypothetical protein